MAFPQVAGLGAWYSSGDVDVTTAPVAYPTGIVAGHLLMNLVFADGDTTTLSMGGGFTKLNETNHSASSVQMAVFYKNAAGTESGTEDVTISGTGEHLTARMLRITGWDTAQAPEITTAEGTGTTPDPPSETASWGSADNLWIAAYSMNGGGAAPTVYPLTDNQHHQGSGGAGAGGGAFCTGESAVATLDPGTFTTATSQTWVAFTIAIAPGSFPTVEQEGYRWGLDDGTEAAHTWAAAQDVTISAGTGLTRLLRVVLNETGGAAAATDGYKVQYKRDDEPASEWRGL